MDVCFNGIEYISISVISFSFSPFFLVSEKELGNYDVESFLSWQVFINAEWYFVYCKLLCWFNFIAIYMLLGLQDQWSCISNTKVLLFLEFYLAWYLCSPSGEQLKQFDGIALFCQSICSNCTLSFVAWLVLPFWLLFIPWSFAYTSSELLTPIGWYTCNSETDFLKKLLKVVFSILLVREGMVHL